ncbi:MAG: hypothetical protein Q8Q32_01615 [bacterium]|nr:hypothetical protein [bacterium]
MVSKQSFAQNLVVAMVIKVVKKHRYAIAELPDGQTVRVDMNGRLRLIESDGELDLSDELEVCTSIELGSMIVARINGRNSRGFYAARWAFASERVDMLAS